MITAIGSGFMAILPLLVKLVVWGIDKFSNNDRMKKLAYDFLSAISKEIPITIHEKYVSRIDELEKKLRQENGEKV